MTPPMTYSHILSSGAYLPPQRVTNADLVARLAADGVQTSDEWIRERTGIAERRFADAGMTTSQMGALAAEQALATAGVSAQEVDCIVLATSTPDMIFPSTACMVQRALGNRGAAVFDIQAVCAGFIYAFSVVDSMIRSGACRLALVIGAEAFSRILDFKDRGTCPLFGDGAAAVLLGASDHAGIRSSVLHADGTLVDILKVPGQIVGGAVTGDPFLRMDGQAVFRVAVQVLEEAAREVLEKAGAVAEDVDWFIPHQANLRIMRSTARKLKFPEERMITTVDRHGNTSAASIPLALDEAIRSGRVQRGQTLLLEGVGGGMTWGAALVDY